MRIKGWRSGAVRYLRYLFVSALVALLVGGSSFAQRNFPQWNAKPPQLLITLWNTSPIVAVGDMTNVRAFGEQHIDHLAAPVVQDLHVLYWCEAEFRQVASIKGSTLRLGAKYLWASVQPGCAVFHGDRQSYDRRVTRVWFLREEGAFLRPTFDGTRQFLGLFTKWEDGPSLPPQQKFGAMLLTPSGFEEGLAGLAANIADVADLACAVLGERECVRRISALAKLGDPALRTAACEYLKAEHGEDCER